MKKESAFAPATIANVSVGFDTLGIALKSIGDTVTVAYNETGQNRIMKTNNGKNLPTDTDKNCCGIVIKQMQKALKSSQGVDIEITKGYAAGSGLGSSSASSSAAALAFNKLIGNKFTKAELVHFAASGETVSGGEDHYDNVAPAIFGGLVLVDANEGIHELPIPKGMSVAVCLQDVEIKTIEARQLLPSEVPIAIARKQWASLGLFVSGLYEEDFSKIEMALNDYIAEPYRKKLIPNYKDLEKIALRNRALNFGISGSGPAVFAFTEIKSQAETIASHWTQYLNQQNQKATIFCEMF